MIRPYQQSDTEQIQDVWFQASQLAHPFLSTEFLNTERENIRTLYLPQADTWVYENNNRVVGFISLLGNEVGALFVYPENHGEGIGRALMDKASSIHAVLELEVFEENPIGRTFYARYGFLAMHDYHHEPSGHRVIRLSYRK